MSAGVLQLWDRITLLLAAMVGDRRVEPDEEQRLVRLARGGGPKGRRAFEQLVRHHERWLMAFLMALLGNRADAEDVAQTAFLKAYGALAGFRGDARFKTWLRRIALNEAYSVRGRRREHVTRDGTPLDAPFEDLGPQSVEAREMVLTVLNRLTYSYREVLALRYVECLSLDAIAAHLDVSKPATKMRIRRARDQFEEVYQALLDEAA